MAPPMIPPMNPNGVGLFSSLSLGRANCPKNPANGPLVLPPLMVTVKSTVGYNIAP